MKPILTILILLWTFAVQGQSLDGPKNIEPREYGQFTISQATDAQLKASHVLVWPEDGTTLLAVRSWGGEAWILFRSTKPGKYQLVVAMPNESGGVVVAKSVVVVGVPEPGPAPGPEPTPDPQPQPPVPGPMRVLFLHEAQDLTKMPTDQLAIRTSPKIRDYLDLKCPKEDGQPAYRFFENNDDLSKLPQWETMRKMAGPMPALVIISEGTQSTNGGSVMQRSVFKGPWPATVDETLDLLKKYGG